jgi:hypothetical protein
VSRLKNEFKLAGDQAERVLKAEKQIAKETDRKEIFKASGSDTLKYQGIGSSAMKDSISQYMSSKMPNVKFDVNKDVQELGLLEKRLAGVTGAMNRMVVSYKTAEGETKTFQVQADRLAGTMIRLEGATKAAGKDMSFMGQLKSAAAGFPIWMIAATAWMQTINAIREGIKYVVDMDSAMADLSKVTDFNSKQLDQMAKSAIAMGKALGQSSIQVAKAQAEAGRLYKNQGEINEISKLAVMASNVSDLSAEQAAKTMNTTLITFKMGVGEAGQVLDQFNEIQNNYRKIYAV